MAQIDGAEEDRNALRHENSSSNSMNESPPTASSPLIKSQQNSNSHNSSDRNAAPDESVPFIGKDDEQHAPSDVRNMVYWILLLHGIGVLLPWNTFLTIGFDYFMQYKLSAAGKAGYKEDFMKYMTLFAQIPNLSLSLLNLFVVLSGGLHRRINISLTVIACTCIVTIIFVFVDSTTWPFGFFLFTMLTVVVLNSANGIYQNSIWGLVADFPGRFTNAIVLGNNLCGIIMTVLYIIIVLTRVNITISASVYFTLALLTVIACFVSFHFLPKFAFYKYYVNKAAKVRLAQGTDVLHEAEDVEQEQPTTPMPASKPSHPSLATYIAVFKEAWPGLLNVWLIFFVTLSLFPAILMEVKLYPTGRPFDIFSYGDEKTSEQLFRQLSIFFNFNLFATIGSYIANFVQWPSRKYLSVPAVVRLCFLPLIWVCNYDTGDHVRNHVLIKNEWAFVFLITLLALTHGYWSSLSMMYAPQQVDQSKSQIVGMMSGFFLVFGIAAGIAFTFAEPYIVNLFG